MKYKTITDLDNRIEKIVKRKVQHYYTDWKNYDRPKYMGFKGSKEKEDKLLFLIVRDSGTWLERVWDLYRENWTTAVFEQYTDSDTSDYYIINLNNKEIYKIDNPELYGQTVKRTLNR